MFISAALCSILFYFYFFLCVHVIYLTTCRFWFMILISKIVQLYFCYFNFYKLWFWYYKYYESEWLTKPRYLTSIRKISAHIVNCKIHFVILISKFLDHCGFPLSNCYILAQAQTKYWYKWRWYFLGITLFTMLDVVQQRDL